MKDYELHARKYPAIVAMILPCLLTTDMVLAYIPQIKEVGTTFINIIEVFIPFAVVYSAVGFFARELFRSASKMLFQFPLFREDETEMPTTNFLLWSSSKRLSDESIRTIRDKAKTDYNITLLTEEEEKVNLPEAKRRIVDVVGKIRETTRNNPNLLQYNIDFGFCRNYLGGAVYSVFFIICIFFINMHLNAINWYYPLIALFIQLLLGAIVFTSLKHKANTYARALFNAYLANVHYQW